MINFTQTLAWKKIVAKLYGLGAAIVIVGALFKLQHWPLAGEMLTIGMSVEAFIFVVSAFEPLPHPDPHWEIVYPELLAGFPEGYQSDHVAGDTAHQIPAAKKGHESSSSAPSVVGAVDLSGVDTKGLTASLSKLTETTNKLTDISQAVASASHLSEKVQKASDSVAAFTQSYEVSSQVLSESMNILSDSCQGAAKSVIDAGKQVGENVGKSGKQLVGVISAASESFATTFTLIDQQVKANLDSMKNNSSYAKHVDSLNKNMNALNAVYALQVQEATQYHKNNKQASEHLTKLVEGLQRSSEENQAFCKGIAHLNENLAELNNIYGNMLSAAQAVAHPKKK